MMSHARTELGAQAEKQVPIRDASRRDRKRLQGCMKEHRKRKAARLTMRRDITQERGDWYMHHRWALQKSKSRDETAAIRCS